MMIKKISTPIYNINEEGLFASRDYADGRLIPSIVISSKEDDYIKEIIKLHSNISMGDVEVQWGGTLSSLFNADRWILNIRFYKPIDYNFSIVFSLKNHYSIIDAIFQSKGLRIAYGHKGEKVSQVSDHIITLNPQLHSRSATYIKRNELLIRKTAIKSSHPFQYAYHPLTP